MLSRQEELSGTSGTNQQRRALGHEGQKKNRKKKISKEKGGKEEECKEELEMKVEKKEC